MKYGPLAAHLSSVSGSTVTLTYDEMEELLGQKLPSTAYGKAWRQWWANTKTHSQGLAWLSAGWLARPDLAHKRVEFRRASPGPNRDVPDSNAPPRTRKGGAVDPIVLPREHLTPSAVRMLEDAADEMNADIGRAGAELLNQASMARRRQLIDWFAENAPRQGTGSVALIRKDRDAR